MLLPSTLSGEEARVVAKAEAKAEAKVVAGVVGMAEVVVGQILVKITIILVTVKTPVRLNSPLLVVTSGPQMADLFVLTVINQIICRAIVGCYTQSVALLEFLISLILK